jgi:hypothetical protein
MGRVLLSIVLGLAAPFVLILGASPFEVPGQNSIKEIVAGSVTVALYLAVCQFLVAPRESRRLGAKWPTMVAMAASLLAVCLLIVALEGGKAWLFSAAPMLIPGCLGILAGAVLAGWVNLLPVSSEVCRRSLLICAALLVAVALVVAAGVVPPVKADTFPQAAPERAVPFFWGIVVVNLLAAADLMSLAIRVTKRRGLSPASLVLPAFLAFASAGLFAAPGFAFLGHGPAMRTASILLLVCSAAEFVVTGLVSRTALVLPKRT